jgi:DNA polymerase III subunit gamma/tau
VWDTKYRPLKFTDVLGQDGTVSVLKSRLKNGTATNTSYIFSGGAGCGKTTLARIFARASICLSLNPEDPEPCNECDNCTAFLEESSPAFREMDAASNGTIDIIRSIVDELDYAVYGSDIRIYLFDEVHRMSPGAQDVLLKPIEDKKLVCLLCTTELNKIRGPIRSRCESHVIRGINTDTIFVRMRMVLEREGVAFEEDAVRTVIDHCGGHVRDVLNKLEMIAQLGDVTVESVREYLDLGVVPLYYEILLALADQPRAVELVEQVCERVAPDEVSAGLAEASMNVYRVAKGLSANWSMVDRPLAQQVYQRFGDRVVRFAEHFLSTRHGTRTGLALNVLTVPWQDGKPLFIPPVLMPQSLPAAPVPIVQAPVVQAAPVAQAVAPDPAPTLVAPVIATTTAPVWDGDELGVCSKLPDRGKSAVVASTKPSLTPGMLKDVAVLQPVEWRATFEDQWRKRQ